MSRSAGGSRGGTALAGDALTNLSIRNRWQHGDAARSSRLRVLLPLHPIPNNIRVPRFATRARAHSGVSDEFDLVINGVSIAVIQD